MRRAMTTNVEFNLPGLQWAEVALDPLHTTAKVLIVSPMCARRLHAILACLRTETSVGYLVPTLQQRTGIASLSRETPMRPDF